MNKPLVLASAAILAASVAQASPTASGRGAQAVKPFAATAGTLYNNTGTDSGLGIVSQNFESSFDIYDSQIADDFKVPKFRKWNITEIDITGVYFNGSGPAQSEHVTIYKDASGKPGAVAADYSELTGLDNGSGSFTITLPKTTLKSGTYWLSVFANMDFSLGGEWAWENFLETVRNPAQWQNPGDGFGTGCTTWGQENVCVPDGQGDNFFVLKGKSRLAP